jgi:hypothetical protein
MCCHCWTFQSHLLHPCQQSRPCKDKKLPPAEKDRTTTIWPPSDFVGNVDHAPLHPSHFFSSWIVPWCGVVVVCVMITGNGPIIFTTSVCSYIFFVFAVRVDYN